MEAAYRDGSSFGASVAYGGEKGKRGMLSSHRTEEVGLSLIMPPPMTRVKKATIKDPFISPKSLSVCK